MENLSNLNPDGLYSFLKFSHPQLTERLAALGFNQANPLVFDEEIAPNKTKEEPIEMQPAVFESRQGKSLNGYNQLEE